MRVSWQLRVARLADARNKPHKSVRGCAVTSACLKLPLWHAAQSARRGRSNVRPRLALAVFLGTRKFGLAQIWLAHLHKASLSRGGSGTVRYQSRGAPSRDASQPAPPAQPAAPASTPAGPRAKAAGGEDERSRLARLQAQRLEELNRGRAGGARGGARSNRPEQRWLKLGRLSTPSATSSAAASIGTSASSVGFAERAVTSRLGLGGVIGAVPLPRLSSPLRTRSNRCTDQGTDSRTADSPSSPSTIAISTRPASSANPSIGSSACKWLAFLFSDSPSVSPSHCCALSLLSCPLRCKGRPAVEVSHIVEFDESAKPYLPADLSCVRFRLDPSSTAIHTDSVTLPTRVRSNSEAMPPSQHWHELRSPDL
ncbi:hypothetical protein L1887_43401 [Cichorium endivia]|nr:hypothetical protein L1887_43401 [Cichorium endivia]